MTTPPSWGTEVLVPSLVNHRHVWGDVQLEPSVTKPATVTWEAQQEPGGPFYEAQVVSRAAGSTGLDRVPFAFAVRPGCKYRVYRTGESGVTEALGNYDHLDA